MKLNLSILRKFLCILMIFAFAFSTVNIDSIARADDVRSAEDVLTELIYLKNRWYETSNQQMKDYLSGRADVLREELRLTKEYKNDVKVSSRNFLVESGTDPGFRKVADTLCYPPYDTIENVEAALDYIKAYNMSFWGEVCIVTGGILFVGTVGYAAATYGEVIIAGAGYTISQWESAVSYAMEHIEPNRINHILQTHHMWSNIFGTGVTWNDVRPVIQEVLLYGQVSEYDNFPSKIMEIAGYIVEVRYFISDGGVMSVTDAWVK